MITIITFMIYYYIMQIGKDLGNPLLILCRETDAMCYLFSQPSSHLASKHLLNIYYVKGTC